MQDNSLTPAYLLRAGRKLQKSCLICGYSAPLDLCVLMENPATMDQPVTFLMERGRISCPKCKSAYITLAAEADSSDDRPLLISRNPFPVGDLQQKKNVVLQGAHNSIFIPYNVDGKDLRRRAPYFDLRKSPESINLLPEIVSADSKSREFDGRNTFSRIIRAINTDSSFSSLGCAWETQPYDGEYLTFGYIDVARVPLASNSYWSVRETAEKLQGRLCESARPGTKYILTIKPGIYQRRPVFVLDIEAIAAGPTEKYSYLEWERLLEDLSMVLVKNAVVLSS